MKPVAIVHTNAKQMLGALVSAYSFRRNSRHPHAFDVRLRVDAVSPGLAVPGSREEPDLLVVAERAGRGAGELGDVADAQRRRLGRRRGHVAPPSRRRC